jgi:hypothetical protein
VIETLRDPRIVKAEIACQVAEVEQRATAK